MSSTYTALLEHMKWAKRWFMSMLMTVYRWVVGYLVDRVFDSIHAFGKKPPPLPPVQNPLLLETALGLASKIRTSQVSSVNVVRAFIQRVEEVNSVVNAVVDDRFAEALEEAARVDELVASGEKSEEELERDTPLLGVPFSVKEAICVEGMLFTTGVVSRRGTRAREDADVVALLRRAGAIPLVVTNTSEQCFWMEAYNNLYGKTNNPYDPRKTAGGSSGGEGALLASAGSVIGVGNDIGGSIRIPAFFNGIFGHKPSRGIISNRGHFPPTEPVLQQYIGTGPMCRYASDLKVMLRIMAGPNADLFRLERQVVNHFRRICDVPPQQVHIRGLKHGFRVWCYTVSAVVTGVARVEARVFGEDSDTSVFREFLSCLFGWSQYSFPTLATVAVEKYLGPRDKDEAAVGSFMRIRRQMEKDFLNLLQDDCVFIMPTLPEPAAYHYANTVRAQNCGYVATFNVLGLPATHCPVGLDKEGMPVGVQVVSGWRNDYLNLAVAREIEREFGGWISPGPIV